MEGFQFLKVFNFKSPFFEARNREWCDRSRALGSAEVKGDASSMSIKSDSWNSCKIQWRRAVAPAVAEVKWETRTIIWRASGIRLQDYHTTLHYTTTLLLCYQQWFWVHHLWLWLAHWASSSLRVTFPAGCWLFSQSGWFQLMLHNCEFMLNHSRLPLFSIWCLCLDRQ